MSGFANTMHGMARWIDPITRVAPKTDIAYDLLGPKTPRPSPGVPNPNDAANASRAMTDQMRMRRGLLANIYAGASNTAPVTGKTQLGT